MLNDKLIMQLATKYINYLDDLTDSKSEVYKELKELYPDIEVVDHQASFIGSNLSTLTIQDQNSKDVAIIYDGNNAIGDFTNDNLNVFINKTPNFYDVALKYFEYIERKNYRITHVGGVSLGGGAAQYVGINYPFVRALCINASPLNKATFIDTKNIIHIRDNSDLLYRAISLDKSRYEEGYVGNLVNINRSLFGSSDYYNHLELSHYGCIPFPDSDVLEKYGQRNLEVLKDVMDEKNYAYYALLKQAPTIGEYMPFDLLSNNILTLDFTPPSFSFDEVQDNFSAKVKEVQKSLQSYLMPLAYLKNKNEFINIDNQLSNDIKSAMKYALLPITKQDASLYDTIQFVIEKSSPYIYKLINDKLSLITKDIDIEKSVLDKEKIAKDLKVNEEAINNIVEYLIKINNDLFDYENFKFKNVFKLKNTLSFNLMPTQYANDYQKDLFDKINLAITDVIVHNKSLINQLEKLIYTTYRQGHLELELPFTLHKSGDIDKDIAFIKARYNIGDNFAKAIESFMPDFYENILGDSALYNYLVSITNINEQLAYLLVSLDNLELYFNQIDKISNNNKRNLHLMINNAKSYINDLLYYNKQSLLNQEKNK